MNTKWPALRCSRTLPEDPVQSCKIVCEVLNSVSLTCTLHIALQILIAPTGQFNVACIPIYILISTFYVYSASSMYKFDLPCACLSQNEKYATLLLLSDIFHFGELKADRDNTLTPTEAEDGWCFRRDRVVLKNRNVGVLQQLLSEELLGPYIFFRSSLFWPYLHTPKSFWRCIITPRFP